MDITISGRDNIQPKSSSDIELQTFTYEATIDELTIPSWMDVESTELLQELKNVIESWMEKQPHEPKNTNPKAKPVNRKGYNKSNDQ